MLYLMNSPVLTGYGGWRFTGPVPVENIRSRLKEEPFTSVIGHESTATFLSRLLEQTVEVNRIRADLQPGDQAVILRLTARLAEGATLSVDELNRIPFELGLLTRIA